MKFIVLTLFPKIFEEYINTSIIKRAINNNLVSFEIVDVRDFSLSKTKAVDDYGYGGGPGMVLSVQPFADAIKKFKTKNSLTINLSPCGETLSQAKAKQLSHEKEIILVCGHYEGIDERINHYVDQTFSIGDYVLTGGELPALVLIDSITRLVPNVIKQASLDSESFNSYLLDYPVYTKPLIYDEHVVPEVLLSGNHQAIAKFRQDQRILKTKQNRQDLYKKYLIQERNTNEN